MNFDAYKNSLPYPHCAAYRKKRCGEIDNTPMTFIERKAAYEALDKEVSEWAKAKMKARQKREKEIEAQFWADCREDLGYSDFLNEEGMKALEAYAWDQGHSYSFSEVYEYLCDLVNLARTLAKSIK